jgi:hypothetical protein
LGLSLGLFAANCRFPAFFDQFSFTMPLAALAEKSLKIRDFLFKATTTGEMHQISGILDAALLTNRKFNKQARYQMS